MVFEKYDKAPEQRGHGLKQLVNVNPQRVLPRIGGGATVIPFEWLDRTDDTWFTGGLDMSWDGSKWYIPGPGSPGLQRITQGGSPGWTEDFRPEKLRVTYTDTGTFELRFYDQDVAQIANVPGYVSLQEVDLDWEGHSDFRWLSFIGATNALEVTKIEFYGQAP